MNKLFLFIVCCITLLSCGNNPPFINSLTANPQTIMVDGTVLLTCDAYDDEDTTLEYIWDCAAGSILGDGSTAIWTAPNETGVFSISCEIMDSNDGHVIETIDLIVTAL